MQNKNELAFFNPPHNQPTTIECSNFVKTEIEPIAINKILHCNTSRLQNATNNISGGGGGEGELSKSNKTKR